jgi:hypothetical protein
MIDYLERQDRKDLPARGFTAKERVLRTFKLEYTVLNNAQFNVAIELLETNNYVEIFNGLTNSKRRDD